MGDDPRRELVPGLERRPDSVALRMFRQEPAGTTNVQRGTRIRLFIAKEHG